jgi:hypothetical protein
VISAELDHLAPDSSFGTQICPVCTDDLHLPSRKIRFGKLKWVDAEKFLLDRRPARSGLPLRGRRPAVTIFRAPCLCAACSNPCELPCVVMKFEGLAEPGRHRLPDEEDAAPEQPQMVDSAGDSGWFTPNAEQLTQLMRAIGQEGEPIDQPPVVRRIQGPTAEVEAPASSAQSRSHGSSYTVEDLAVVLGALRKWDPGPRVEATDADRAEAAAYMEVVQATNETQVLASMLSRQLGSEFTCYHSDKANALVLEWNGDPAFAAVQEAAWSLAEEVPHLDIGKLVYLPRVGEVRSDPTADREQPRSNSSALARAS